jgi:hypothetical protein
MTKGMYMNPYPINAEEVTCNEFKSKAPLIKAIETISDELNITITLIGIEKINIIVVRVIRKSDEFLLFLIAIADVILVKDIVIKTMRIEVMRFDNIAPYPNAVTDPTAIPEANTLLICSLICSIE